MLLLYGFLLYLYHILFILFIRFHLSYKIDKILVFLLIFVWVLCKLSILRISIYCMFMFFQYFITRWCGYSLGICFFLYWWFLWWYFHYIVNNYLFIYKIKYYFFLIRYYFYYSFMRCFIYLHRYAHTDEWYIPYVSIPPSFKLHTILSHLKIPFF